MAKKGSGKRKRKKSSSSKPSFAVWVGVLLLPCAFYGGLHMCVKQGNSDTLSPGNGLEQLTALQNEKLVLSHKIQAVSNSLHTDHQNAIALPAIETSTELEKQPSAHQTFKGKLAELLRGTSWSGHINHIQIGKGEYTLKVSVTTRISFLTGYYFLCCRSLPWTLWLEIMHTQGGSKVGEHMKHLARSLMLPL
jgi:hypothetical protein